ncbi:hypothetical protein G7Y89_g14860 [Cudoniella acicularis]|uniref:Uncharacterized protein n=1 Tax=Cudoniella acicularis TaxID=354080 RepID=A0A8H4VQC3_9HELO|nr:hypothetical protein G7Y89_g14860 [Cudoniella acicularis]
MSKPSPYLTQFSTPPKPAETWSTSLINVAVQALLIIVIYARFRATGYDVSALEWDDYALMLVLVGVWYTRRPVVYMVV